jgi:hypothetical protein
MVRIVACRTAGLQRLAFCCFLISAARPCVTQEVQNATVVPSVAATIAPAPSSNGADLPSAPVPADEITQTDHANQAPASAQKQQGQTNQQQQKPETAPSLGDLGFTPEQTQANAQMQARLNERTHMLKVHQMLGLITTIPMVATLITGPQAKAKGRNGEPITEPTAANLDFHMALGGLTAGMYWTSAYYAIFAPKISDVKPKGAIRLHRALEWVHGPGMIITPALGILAYKQENAGEKVHGITSYHGTAAYVTAAAYGTAIVAVSWPIHLKFWEKQ